MMLSGSRKSGYDRVDDPDVAELEVAKVEQSGRWLTSYADVSTLLLCFFILFFSVDRGSNDLSFIADSFRTTMPFVQPSARERPVADSEPTAVGEAVADMREVATQFSLVSDVFIQRDRESMIIDFHRGQFFDRGRYRLNALGREQLGHVIRILQPYADQIEIKISGYADPVPVSGGRIRFQSNMELSALRAAHVYDLLENRGFDGSAMSIQGFGASRAESEALEGREGSERRVSFMIKARP